MYKRHDSTLKAIPELKGGRYAPGAASPARRQSHPGVAKSASKPSKVDTLSMPIPKNNLAALKGHRR